MPRPAGQTDEKKTRAILNAARDLFLEKGLGSSMSEIARRAGVSKQTLYNRFATRSDIARALAELRSDAITEPLRSNGSPEDVLTALAEALLYKVCVEHQGTALRGVALMSPEAPDIAQAIYDGGPGSSLQRLADWLVLQNTQGLIETPDPLLAAEIFTGMVLGHSHLRSMLGLEHPRLNSQPEQARDAARRFLRAFAPLPT